MDLLSAGAEIVSLHGRILAVDLGEKYIGIAISDPTGTLARPLTILRHRSRAQDAEAILELARAYRVHRIVVGVATDAQGHPTTLQARRAANLARALQGRAPIPVDLWDESFTTKDIRHLWARLGRRGRRHRRPDASAAALLLQSYLDAHRTSS